MWGAYFCKGAYKRNPDVVIKMGAYICWVHILYGCLLSQFYGTAKVLIDNQPLELWLHYWPLAGRSHRAVSLAH